MRWREISEYGDMRPWGTNFGWKTRLGTLSADVRVTLSKP